MIDVSAVRAALEAVLADGPVPHAAIGRLGDLSFSPPAAGLHLRTSLIWHRQGKTGAVLTEGEGTWQVLCYAPEGTTAAALEASMMGIGVLYEPFVDGPELAEFVRITEVAALTTVAGQDGADMGGLRWVIAPLQVD